VVYEVREQFDEDPVFVSLLAVIAASFASSEVPEVSSDAVESTIPAACDAIRGTLRSELQVTAATLALTSYSAVVTAWGS